MENGVPPLIGPRPAPLSSSSENLSPVDVQTNAALHTTPEAPQTMQESEDEVVSGPESSDESGVLDDDDIEDSLDDTILDEQRVTVPFSLDEDRTATVDLFELGGCRWSVRASIRNTSGEATEWCAFCRCASCQPRVVRSSQLLPKAVFVHASSSR
jgi:hypothetical protein